MNARIAEEEGAPDFGSSVEFEFAPIVNHHVERDLLNSVVTRTY